ncbi:sensor domain-containing protein [Actinocrispum sp. NPDC049592]|uniref:sensor histidine kinase n=1 Tax=Actinocrispum sp. NPDC049592 TaxID=3154835 RepID=UPI0034315BF7
MPVARKLGVIARNALDGLEHLVGGLGTAVLAFAAMFGVLITAAACVIGVGLLIAPFTLRVVRAITQRERSRLSRWRPDEDLASPVRLPDSLIQAVRDRDVLRELAWVGCHGSAGFVLGLMGLALPLGAVRDIVFPLYWRLLPESEATGQLSLWTAHDWAGAFAVTGEGLVFLVLSALLIPGMARLQERYGRKLLDAEYADLHLRIAELTATRAAALDAHTAELRRIERSLHDGTQNRLVAVNVLLGAARRALARNSPNVDDVLVRAQDATEQALAELRAVVRSILPPVLIERSLPDALSALAAACPVPCMVDAQLDGRCATSVEATAYFVVAETLTNVAKHSQARSAVVQLFRHRTRLFVTIRDDGRGGADEREGSGIDGIRRRVEAHDGEFTLNSPPGGPTTVRVTLPCG